MKIKLQILLLFLLISKITVAQNNYSIEFEVRENSENGKPLYGVLIEIVNPTGTDLTDKNGRCLFYRVSENVRFQKIFLENFSFIGSKRLSPPKSYNIREVVFLGNSDSKVSNETTTFLSEELNKLLKQNETDKSQIMSQLVRIDKNNYGNSEIIKSANEKLELIEINILNLKSSLNDLNNGILKVNESLTEINTLIINQRYFLDNSQSSINKQLQLIIDEQNRSNNRREFHQEKLKKTIYPTSIGIGASAYSYIYQYKYNNKLDILKFYIAKNQNNEIRQTYDEIDKIKSQKWIYWTSLGIVAGSVIYDTVILSKKMPKENKTSFLKIYGGINNIKICYTF